MGFRMQQSIHRPIALLARVRTRSRFHRLHSSFKQLFEHDRHTRLRHAHREFLLSSHRHGP
ncbi:hypothetical protein EJ04DRAFT_131160 [Polyplosphaeria fusca]|uniref:Uncharacterized protein n=1 Tax=Polyplosphaeria fusca TaxID=682080 RepID=A0A9P4R129_9PLEO|nr:hypothetical protein EJ04DRAFT_131160 [Polyplosphaeria fusca]